METTAKKTIEERAILNLEYEQDFCGRALNESMVCRAYIKGWEDAVKALSGETRNDIVHRAGHKQQSGQ